MLGWVSRRTKERSDIAPYNPFLNVTFQPKMGAVPVDGVRKRKYGKLRECGGHGAEPSRIISNRLACQC